MVSALAAWAGTRPGAESADALASMYADLSGQRASDPAAFRARVAWWSATLREACWQNVDGAGSPLVLALDDAAPTRWAREDAGRPVCLSVVVATLAERQQAMCVSEYTRRTAPLAARGWARVWRDWVARPAASWWAGDADDDEALWAHVHGAWVLCANVERAAELAMAAWPTPTTLVDAVIPLEVVRQQLAALTDDGRALRLTPQDVDVLLAYLERDAGALVRAGDVAKIVRGTNMPRTIGEQERSVCAVKRAHAQLGEQVSRLEAERHEADATLRDAVRARAPRGVQLSYLASRRQLDELWEKRVGAQRTVRELLLKLEQAASEAELVKTYEASSQLLRSILANPALAPARIDEAVGALQDAMDEHAEVSDALAAPAAAAVDDDDDELARELEALRLEATAPAAGAAPKVAAHDGAAPKVAAHDGAAHAESARSPGAAAAAPPLPEVPRHAPTPPAASEAPARSAPAGARRVPEEAT